jgi:hypothetical protein
MRKGPIILGIGILLVVLSLPLALAYTLYEEENVDMGDFEEDWDHEEYDTVYTYTFEKVGPGKITVSARSFFFTSDPIRVRIIDEDRSGEVIANYELEGGTLFWEDRSTVIDHEGDYTVWIGTYEDEFFDGEFRAKYSGRYSMAGLLSFILGFPIFLITGLVLIVVGSFSIYRSTTKDEGEPGYEEEYSQFRVHDMKFTEDEAGEDYYYTKMKEGIEAPTRVRKGSVKMPKRKKKVEKDLDGYDLDMDEDEDLDDFEEVVVVKRTSSKLQKKKKSGKKGPDKGSKKGTKKRSTGSKKKKKKVRD